MTESYCTEIALDAPPETVFEHLTDADFLTRWMGQYAETEAVAGGVFEADVNGVPIRGRYRVVEPPHRVVLSWGVAGSAELPPGSTEVEFTLTPTASGTLLRLEHRSLPDSQAPAHAIGWTPFLDRLRLAASGQDPGADPWDEAPPG